MGGAEEFGWLKVLGYEVVSLSGPPDRFFYLALGPRDAASHH